MDFQTIINFALTATSAVIGWFARELWAAIKELKADLAKLREELPKQYIAKDDYRNDMHDIKEMLSKIFDKLDNKQDK
jgi:hypothetical protein